MRLLIAFVAAFAAVAFAAPSFAQEAAPTPAPSAKPKPGTSAYCNTLKSSTSKASCRKRVHASAKAPHKAKTKKVEPAKTNTSAQYTPPPVTPAQAPSTSQTVAIPPLPQKTI
jgi:hypothetical protein